MNKNLILILLLISVVTPTTFANPIDCATVSTKANFLKNNEYRLKLFHSGEIKSAISLTPGRHKLSAQIIFDKINRFDDQNTFTFIKKHNVSEIINFDLDVKKNTIYYIIAKAEGRNNKKLNNSFEILVKKEAPQLCKSDKQPKVVKDTKRTSQDNTIPENLQYRLDLVMMDIKAFLHNSNQRNKTVTIEGEERIINILGIVTNRKASFKNGINILAITPFSIAAKIGLKPNDTILAINGLDLTFNNKQLNKNLPILTLFKNTLVNLSEDEKVNIEIMRENKKTSLLSDYKELALPTYQLKIMMN